MNYEINFMPWRENIKKNKNKKFLYILSFVVSINLLVLYFIYSILSSEVNTYKSRISELNNYNSFLDISLNEISSLERNNKTLIDRINEISKLQENRTDKVNVLNTLTENIPDEIHFKVIEMNKNSINLNGISKNKEGISDLLRYFNTTEFYNNENLRYVRNVNNTINNEFNISVDFKWKLI